MKIASFLYLSQWLLQANECEDYSLVNIWYLTIILNTFKLNIREIQYHTILSNNKYRNTVRGGGGGGEGTIWQSIDFWWIMNNDTMWSNTF